MSTLSILITRFPAHFADPLIKPQPLTAITPLLTHSRPAVRKRAILTLSQFFPVSPPELCSHLLLGTVLPNLESNANLEQQRTTVTLVTAILRQSPQQLTTSLNQIIPGILKAVQRDDDELREGCLQVWNKVLIGESMAHATLQALETLLLRSPAEATPFVSSTIQIGMQYIKYDPVRSLHVVMVRVLIVAKNYTGGDDDEEMAEADEDDDEELDDESVQTISDDLVH